MIPPLVSVICLCYNHERFVAEAIRSVKAQTYPHVQLIVVDDHSNDNSASTIKEICIQNPGIEFVALEKNAGNCSAFNHGLRKSTGDFIIDLAADDVLLPERIEKGIDAFQTGSQELGVNFTDAQLINENGESLGLHSDRFPHASIPQGDIYLDIISKYFICSPSMMIRRTVMDRLDGYDETLAYEDFDFWVRSSRHFEYSYTPEPLVKKRILPTSLGQGQHKRGSKQLMTTLKVCEKILTLNRTDDEQVALRKRVWYEMRRALFLGEFKLAFGYWELLREMQDKM